MAGMAPEPRYHRKRCSAAGVDGQRGYARHRPEDTVLYQTVEQHVGAFFETVSEQGASLPGFVREALDAYLRCGRLEGGLLRVKCTRCRHEHVIAFSRRKRGFCPSCGARRMVDGAARLVDHVLPHVPMRQWVVTFPWPLRLLFAARPALLTRVLGVVTRAVSTSMLRRAGLTVRSGAKTGIVTCIQRFSSNLALNVHLHMLVPDGAYSFERDRPRFHRIPAPSHDDLQRLLDALIRRITRTLVRAGVLIEDPLPDASGQTYLNLEADSPLDELSAAAVRYRIVVGPLAGRKTMTLHDPTRVVQGAPSKPFTVSRDGFSLNAAVACEPHQRDKLARVCRYLLRPPIALERLRLDADGLAASGLAGPARRVPTGFGCRCVRAMRFSPPSHDTRDRRPRSSQRQVRRFSSAQCSRPRSYLPWRARPASSRAAVLSSSPQPPRGYPF